MWSSALAYGSRTLSQPCFERAVDLDDVDEPGSLREALGEDAEPASDLEHDVPVIELGQPLDDVEDVAVDEKVLTERARTCPARAHQPNTAAAVGVDGDVEARHSATRRATAIAWAVSTTFAGVFGLPRIGTGARYGASVSTSSRSAGTRIAASISAVAFG